MFGSSTLEVAIGLAFVFLLLSLICTTLTEMIARWFSLRSRTLEEGIRGMLGENPTPSKGWSAVVTFWHKALRQHASPPVGPAIELADDKTPGGKLYNHPLIAGLTGRSWLDMVRDQMGRPSYIPSRTFALALLDTFAPADAAQGPHTLLAVRQKVAAKAVEDLAKEFLKGIDIAASSAEEKQLLDELKTGFSPDKVKKLLTELVKDINVAKVDKFLLDLAAACAQEKAAKALLPLLDAAGDDLKAARENVEKWFDDAMERVSGWYKRRTQLIILILALAVAGVFNADTFMIASRFSTDASLRDAVVNAAQQAVQKDSQTLETTAQEAKTQLDKLQIPVGWTRKPGETCKVENETAEFSFGHTRPCSGYGWLMKIVGLLLTAVALTLGAPFWFDTLSKLVKLRSSGDKPTKEAAQGATASRP